MQNLTRWVRVSCSRLNLYQHGLDQLQVSKSGFNSRTGISFELLFDWWLVPPLSPAPAKLEQRRPEARPGVKGVEGVVGIRTAVDRSSGEIGTPDWRRVEVGVVGSVAFNSLRSKRRAIRKGLRSLFFGRIRARMAT